MAISPAQMAWIKLFPRSSFWVFLSFYILYMLRSTLKVILLFPAKISDHLLPLEDKDASRSSPDPFLGTSFSCAFRGAHIMEACYFTCAFSWDPIVPEREQRGEALARENQALIVVWTCSLISTPQRWMYCLCICARLTMKETRWWWAATQLFQLIYCRKWWDKQKMCSQDLNKNKKNSPDNTIQSHILGNQKARLAPMTPCHCQIWSLQQSCC